MEVAEALAPDTQKAQTRIFLNVLYSSSSVLQHPEGIQWRTMEKITNKDISVSLVLGQGLFFSITRGTNIYFIPKKTMFFTNILKYNYF